MAFWNLGTIAHVPSSQKCQQWSEIFCRVGDGWQASDRRFLVLSSSVKEQSHFPQKELRALCFIGLTVSVRKKLECKFMSHCLFKEKSFSPSPPLQTNLQFHCIRQDISVPIIWQLNWQFNLNLGIQNLEWKLILMKCELLICPERSLIF